MRYDGQLNRWRRSIIGQSRQDAVISGSKNRSVVFVLLSSLAIILSSPQVVSSQINRELPLNAGFKSATTGVAVEDGTYKISFKLYTVASGGTAVWTETQTIAVTGGLLSARLGAVTAIPSSVTFDGSDYYLGVTAEGDSEMTPRLKVGAVPTALNADRLDGYTTTTSGAASSVLVSDSSGGLTLQSGLTVGSHILPSANGTLNLGSSTAKFATLYANTLSADSTVINGTTEEAFTINTDQTANNTEDSAIRFYLGPTLNTHAALQWTAASDRFDLYSRLSSSTLGDLRLANLTATGTLSVTGATTLASTLGVTGNLAVNTDKFTVTASSGNTAVGGTLAVTGAATLSSTLAVTSNATVGGTLGVTGDTTLSSALDVTGVTTLGRLTANGDSSIGNTDITLGDAATDQLVVTAAVASNFVPLTDNTYDLGASNKRWANFYAASAVFDQLTTPNTTANSFVINSDNATADTEDATLEFELGSVTPNAIIGWDSTSEYIYANKAFVLQGNTTLGDASTDTVTVNAAAWTFANDTAITLSGGVDGINFDANTLSVDATNDRVGIGTAAPSYKLNIVDGATAANTAGLYVTQTGTITGTGYGGYFTKTGASTTNVGLYATASGATNNYAALFDAGSVGVGDTTPDFLLDVAGTFGVDGNITLGDAFTDTLTVNSVSTFVGSAEGTATATLTAGDLVITDGDLTLSGGEVAITTDDTTTDAVTISGNTLTTGQTLAVIYDASTHTSGNVFEISDADAGVDFAVAEDGATTITGSAEGTAALTLTTGDIVVTDGDLTLSGGEVAVTSDDTTTNATTITANSLTTGIGLQVTSSSLTAGSLLDLTTTSTAAASNTQKGFNVAMSGANGTDGQTTYGGYISNTHTGTTSTNVGLYVTASGGTNNYAALFASGNVGIGDTTPDFLLDVAGTFGTDGNVTLGDASTDTVTVNSAAWTFANDTAITLSGGVDGINFDANTLSIDATANRVGIGTASPDTLLNVGSGSGVAAWFDGGDSVEAGLLVDNGSTIGRLAVSGATQTDLILYDADSSADQKMFRITTGGTNNLTQFQLVNDAFNAIAQTFFALDHATGRVGIGDTDPAALLTVGSGDLFQVNTSGAIAAVVGITNTSALTSSGGTVSLNASSNFATNINTGTSTGALTLGGGSGTVAINSSDWDISTTGDITGVGSITADGTLTVSTITATGALAVTSAANGNISLTPNGTGDIQLTVSGNASQDVLIGDGGTTNYAKFDTSGALSFAGAARPYSEIFLTPNEAIVPATNGCTASAVTAGAGSPAINYLTNDCDAATDETVFWQFKMPQNYATGTNVQVDVYWIANATSGAAILDAGYAAVANGENWDGASITNTAGAAVTTNATAYYLNTSTVTLSAPSITADDIVALRILRDADNASDTLTVDGKIVKVRIKYLVGN